MDRISDQTKGLVDDVKEWVDLRVRLVQLDLEDRLETIANQAILTLVIVGIAAAGIFFVLVAAAFALGDLLANTSLGFLGIAILLGCVSWLTNRWRPRFITASRLIGTRVGKKHILDTRLSESANNQISEAGRLPSSKSIISSNNGGEHGGV